MFPGLHFKFRTQTQKYWATNTLLYSTMRKIVINIEKITSLSTKSEYEEKTIRFQKNYQSQFRSLYTRRRLA